MGLTTAQRYAACDNVTATTPLNRYVATQRFACVPL